MCHPERGAGTGRLGHLGSLRLNLREQVLRDARFRGVLGADWEQPRLFDGTMEGKAEAGWAPDQQAKLLLY